MMNINLPLQLSFPLVDTLRLLFLLWQHIWSLLSSFLTSILRCDVPLVYVFMSPERSNTLSNVLIYSLVDVLICPLVHVFMSPLIDVFMSLEMSTFLCPLKMSTL